jgi:nicotinate-nucleotide adenylyltransferase
VGLFGGSFDPIHEGHLHAAREAQSAFSLDRVVFMPAYRSPFKPGIQPASAEHRLAMVHLATAGTPGWSVSTLELERGGASYTIDTVRDLRQSIGEPDDAELFLVVGSDNVPGLPGWRDIDELLERVQPVIVYRDGDPSAMLVELERKLTEEQAHKVAAGFLHLAPVEVSSTELRRELSGLSGVHERVPQAVLDYIREHELYEEA